MRRRKIFSWLKRLFGIGTIRPVSISGKKRCKVCGGKGKVLGYHSGACAGGVFPCPACQNEGPSPDGFVSGSGGLMTWKEGGDEGQTSSI